MAPIGYRYNFLMAWAIRTTYTSKCVKMDPQQLPKTSKFYSKCNKCDIEKPVGGTTPGPLGSLKVNIHVVINFCVAPFLRAILTTIA